MLNIAPCPTCATPVTSLDTPAPDIAIARPCGHRVLASWDAGGVPGNVQLQRVEDE